MLVQVLSRVCGETEAAMAVLPSRSEPSARFLRVSGARERLISVILRAVRVGVGACGAGVVYAKGRLASGYARVTDVKDVRYMT